MQLLSNSRSDWMMNPPSSKWRNPKVAQMIAAVYSKGWAYAEELSNRFYKESFTPAKLVDMKLRCKS